MRSYETNKKLIIRNPHSTRPWQHVLEPIFGYLYFAYTLSKTNQLNGDVYNFGPKYKNTFNRDVLDVINELNKYFSDMKIDIHKKHNDKESNLLSLNINKASKKLNWRPVLSFNESIRLTAEWYLAYFNNEDLANFTQNQIEYYYKKFMSS